MKFFKNIFKKKSALLFSGFALSTFLVNLHQSDLKSYPNTVEECSGSIPSGENKCLVNPTSFRLDIHGVYICRSDPFPASSIKANLNSCMTLYETNDDPFPAEFANNTFTLPPTGMGQKVNGYYSHVAVIFTNKFIGSGKYTANGTTWRTIEETEEGVRVTSSQGEPEKNIDPVTQWRDENDADGNPYCKDGGTLSRCEADYNGYKVTGIITDSELNATYHNSASRLFYLANFLFL